MAVPTSWLRACAAMLLLAGLLGLGLGCKGKSHDSGTTVEGTVTYLRTPLHVGADGVPTGLETDASLNVSLPARGVQVRAYQGISQVDAYGNQSTAWVLSGTTTTDIYGYYKIGGLTVGCSTFVELDSIATGTYPIRIVGDPDGIASALPEPSRVIYSQRFGVDGVTSATSPSTPVATPGTALERASVVNINVGLNDDWILMPLNWNTPSTNPNFSCTKLNAGSRVMAILDSAYTFSYVYGNAAPGALDLHYRPGIRNPRGSFVEYDTTLYPKAYDDKTLHYFGSIAGTTTVGGTTYEGDAFYEGVLFPIFGRNNLFGQKMCTPLPTAERLTSLTPPLAVVDGLADVMAASLLQSPYLPDTSLLDTLVQNPAPVPPARYPARDIRDLSAFDAATQLDEFSVPNIRALGWQMTLQANLITAPGLPSDWLTITSPSLLRLFKLIQPDTITTTLGNNTVISGVNSLLVQMGRMQEGQTSLDTVNLAGYFPDQGGVMSNLLSSFHIAWPTTAAIPNYTLNWGADPDTLATALPSFTLSMAKARKVKVFDPATSVESEVYPNVSNGEVQTAMFSLSVDKTYNLSLATVPALPAGATLEVTLDAKGQINQGVYLFGDTNPRVITLNGNYNDLTTPMWHYLQIRLLSPSTLQPDLQVTLKLDLVR